MQKNRKLMTHFCEKCQTDGQTDRWMGDGQTENEQTDRETRVILQDPPWDGSPKRTTKIQLDLVKHVKQSEKSKDDHFSFKPFTENEVINAILKLTTNKATVMLVNVYCSKLTNYLKNIMSLDNL